ncbi:hypothetical protein EI42_06301 [Thermosporothrix hazakensis]|jgi:hypothetical protein|uniref:Uncharacterized protein n=1 Tax=Thermosporothrix hazakensis TaxID=644383 RepID=A0A326TQP4_THEHA|nr:hypothetical protein EI42_06301 [Thermosporothrix hazakensis]GCE50340.1 hypothetical protein KTH_52090 [Thermosporothrix hazakensis]
MVQGTMIEMPTFESVAEHDEFELDVRVTVSHPGWLVLPG